MVDQKYVLRTCLLYDFKMGKNAADSHRDLCSAFGEQVITERSCQLWFAQFRDGNESLEDESHGHRATAIDNNELEQLIEADPMQTTRELAKHLQCDHSTIVRHLEIIGKTNRNGQWVPHQLSVENLGARVSISHILLHKSKRSHFFENILTMDEKWIHFDNTSRKRQWLSKGQAPIPTPKPDYHGRKVMLSCWWNINGLVHFELLEPGKTVDSSYFIQQLKKVDEILREKGLNPSTINFLRDNAPAHTAKTSCKELEKLGWKVLPHAPYSPDLAPSDFHLFRSMQHSLENCQFKNAKEVENWVTNYFASQNQAFFEKGIRNL